MRSTLDALALTRRGRRSMTWNTAVALAIFIALLPRALFDVWT